MRWGNLIKTVFILLSIFLSVSVALRASVKRVKESSTKAVAKADPGEWKKVIEAAKKEGKIVIGFNEGIFLGKGAHQGLDGNYFQPAKSAQLSFSLGFRLLFGLGC